MNPSRDLGTILGIVICAVLTSGSAQAQPARGEGGGAHMEHHMRHHGPGAARHGPGRHGDHDGHARAWMRSLSDAQRAQVDQMHLDFSRKRVPLQMKRRLARVELGLLATRDTPDTGALDAKIDEIVALQREMMQLHVRHIGEVRAVLTEEQRVSFDTSVLERMKSKHHARH